MVDYGNPERKLHAFNKTKSIIDQRDLILAWECGVVFNFCVEHDLRIINGGVSVHEYALNVSCTVGPA